MQKGIKDPLSTPNSSDVCTLNLRLIEKKVEYQCKNGHQNFVTELSLRDVKKECLGTTGAAEVCPVCEGTFAKMSAIDLVFLDFR